MNQPPLVSIISPAYNHEKYISDCIESVLAQTYPNWEMIIIDDGSTDSTFSIAVDYSKKDSRIKPFTQNNIGIFRLGESYNFALSQCTGKYVAILECDDVWLPEKLALQVEVLEQKPECVLSWGRAYLASGDLSYNYYLTPRDTEISEDFYNKPAGIFLEKFIFHSAPPALTLVIRREAIDKIGGFIQEFNLPLVDFTTTIRLLMMGEFAYIDQPLGYWRIYSNQITKTYTAEITKGCYSVVKSLMQNSSKIFIDNELTEKKIDKLFKNKLIISYSRSGRYKLIRKDYEAARKDYIKSITQNGFSQPVWKLRSLIGIFFSFLKMDIEGLARLLGKKTYK